ncbi:scopoletin glucosyltransferase-like [Spinacia oleracea]|uniref:Scopoletin glucosyltransferase-like n=1 Tax=Spinacia oleracea TaxID=3562 RepID=A0A9R0IQE3_SPIOL|nr:scopoletin glucosyltransferase-like [Spinacia oleracea]
MGAEPQRLHVVFFPLMAAGHMIPTLDIAKLFAAHHVKTTIVTTPLNAPTFTKALNTTTTTTIDVEVIPFPNSNEADGIPEGIENFDQFTSNEMAVKFLKATTLLQQSLEQILEKHKPDCLVADMLLPFATDVAAKFNIPRLVFHGTNYFSQCVTHSMIKYEPFKTVSSDDEEFLIPYLPHEVKLMKSQLPDMMRGDLDMDMDIVNSEWMEIFVRAMEAEAKSYGVIVNSFHELEPEYADYYRNVIGRRAWSIGPVSLCNRENEAKFQRGKDSCIDEHECLNWLNSKKPNSVVYICFGSLAQVSNSQVEEIAMGLEASEQDFIWVLRGSNTKNIEEFEKRVEGKGLIIRGWAPQVLILDHEAIGTFVTHCGWNSTLEGLSCGVPMVTWPVFAEQFYNEKLVTQVLETGVGVGAKEWNRMVEGIKWEDIRDAIRKLMVGEEALELRSKAKKMKELARMAVEVGGSSYCDLSSLIQELSSYNNATTYARD